MTATLAEFEAAARKYLHLENVDHLRFALAVAVSSRLDGDPLWGMVVGPPSSGKTEAVRALDCCAEHVDELTAASLITWQPGKNGGKPIGVLTYIESPAFITIGDFSTILATSDRGGREELFALLRRAYDGRVVRTLGNAPQPLRWEGRLTILAAVTPAIDNFSAHANSLGPRWLFLRMPEAGTRASRRALDLMRVSQATLEDHRTTMRNIAAEILPGAVARAQPAELSDTAWEVIADAALVACIGRVAVERSGHGAREITGLPVREEPPRLAGQLHLLAKSLLGLGLTEPEAVRLTTRAALDSMPQDRRRVLAALAAGEPLTETDLERDHEINRKVARFALEDLATIGVTTWPGIHDDEHKKGTRKEWRLNGADAPLLARVVSWDEKGEPPTPPPPTRGTGASHTSSQLNGQGPETPSIEPERAAP